MEIELRARIASGVAMTKKLRKLQGVKHKGRSHENDRYYRHAADVGRTLVLRIRRITGGATLTFKMKARGADTAWPDVDMSLGHPQVLEGILRSSNYVLVVEIDKQRSSFQYRKLEINVDSIRGLGTFIEIEGRGNQHQRKQVEAAIQTLFKQLGIKEESIIRKGYVPLALEKHKTRK